jgi:regulator of RNase E activity RraA
MPEASAAFIIKTVIGHYPGVQGIYLFGSYGLKQEWLSSDIDIALLLPPLQAKREKNLPLSQCRYDLEEALHREVDLINARLVSTVLQKEIIGNGRAIYVADAYGKIVDGTLIGDNLGNSIYAKSNRGVIFYGSVRDQEGLSEIKGFNGWIKGQDPSYIQQMSLVSINAPIRVGRAIVLPGDVVLAKKFGVIFIPAHLVEDLVITSEVTALRDQFGHQRLREKKYLAGQIDSQWTEEIKKDFMNWLKNYPGKLPMGQEELDKYFKERNW